MDINLRTAQVARAASHSVTLKPVSKAASETVREMDTPVSGAYDTVTISKNSTSSDSDFVKGIVRQVKDQISRPVSSDRVAELKELYQSGQYEPDSRRIAEKLLGYFG